MGNPCQHDWLSPWHWVASVTKYPWLSYDNNICHRVVTYFQPVIITGLKLPTGRILSGQIYFQRIWMSSYFANQNLTIQSNNSNYLFEWLVKIFFHNLLNQILVSLWSLGYLVTEATWLSTCISNWNFWTYRNSYKKVLISNIVSKFDIELRWWKSYRNSKWFSR